MRSRRGATARTRRTIGSSPGTAPRVRPCRGPRRDPPPPGACTGPRRRTARRDPRRRWPPPWPRAGPPARCHRPAADPACAPAAERHDLEVAIPLIAGDRDGAIGLLDRRQVGWADLGLGEGEPTVAGPRRRPAPRAATSHARASRRPSRHAGIGSGTAARARSQTAAASASRSSRRSRAKARAAQLEGTDSDRRATTVPGRGRRAHPPIGLRPRRSGTRRALSAQFATGHGGPACLELRVRAILPMMAPNRMRHDPEPAPISTR